MENNRRESIIRSLICLILSSAISIAAAADKAGRQYELDILDTIRSIQQLDHQQAMQQTRELLREYPHSRLGQMLFADLLLAKAA
ncbi:MAG: hypothetical protein ACI8XC_002098, partial [Gammaproteobacteria bacterium]